MDFFITKEFDSKKHSAIINKIKKEKNKAAQEPYYMVIAEDILENLEGFSKIIKRPDLKGTPFDFAAEKNKELTLIELKGSLNKFNYPSLVQYSRLFHVVNKFEKKKIKCSTLLLQINLKSSQYQILDIRKLTANLGLKTTIDPIIKDIIERMEKEGFKFY